MTFNEIRRKIDKSTGVTGISDNANPRSIFNLDEREGQVAREYLERSPVLVLKDDQGRVCVVALT